MVPKPPAPEFLQGFLLPPKGATSCSSRSPPQGPAQVTFAIDSGEMVLETLEAPRGPYPRVSSLQQQRRESLIWQTPIHPSEPILNGPYAGEYFPAPSRGADSGFPQHLPCRVWLGYLHTYVLHSIRNALRAKWCLGLFCTPSTQDSA